MKKIALTVVLWLFVVSSACAGSFGVSLGWGQANDGIDVFRAGVTKDYGFRWFESDTGYLSGYFELSMNHWSKGGDDINGVALSPVLAYYFNTANPQVTPYVEAGIGAAYIDQETIDARDLGSGFQFEDRIGLGVRIHAVDLNLRYMHYSNGGIEAPNDGIDVLVGTLAWHF